MTQRKPRCSGGSSAGSACGSEDSTPPWACWLASSGEACWQSAGSGHGTLGNRLRSVAHQQRDTGQALTELNLHAEWWLHGAAAGDGLHRTCLIPEDCRARTELTDQGQ